jgi:hypothetical protein
MSVAVWVTATVTVTGTSFADRDGDRVVASDGVLALTAGKGSLERVLLRRALPVRYQARRRARARWKIRIDYHHSWKQFPGRVL